MKQLLSAFLLCLFAITVQAQTPYLSATVSGANASNDLAIGADFGSFNAYLTGSMNYRDARNYLGAGVGYSKEVFKPSNISFLRFFGETDLIVGVDAKGVIFNHPNYTPTQNDTGIPAGFILRGNIGFSIPSGNSNLTITTGYEKLIYEDNPHYYVPVTLGISL